MPLFCFDPSFQTPLLEIFTNSMDPETPEYCTHFYESGIVFIESCNDIPTLPLTHSKFFPTALRFLTYPRTQEDLRRLDLRMSKCHCPQTGISEMLHSEAVVFHAPINLSTLFESLAILLTRCFEEISGPRKDKVIPLDTTRKRAKKARKEGRKAPWPEQASDLFIFPPQQMLFMLWQIFHTYETVRVLSFLQTITTAAGTTFISLFHTIPSLPQDYLHHFERAASSIKDEYAKLDAIAGIWASIFSPSTSYLFERITLWLPHIHTLLTLFTKVIVFLSSQPELDTGKLVYYLSHCGADLIRKYSTLMVLDLTQYAPEILRLVTVHRNETVSEWQGGVAIPVVWWRVRQLAQSDKCQAPGCGETFSKQNRRFAACSGCDIVSYCSKPCQVAAWKHPRIPHRPFCKLLKAYSDKFVKQGLNWRKVDSQNVTMPSLRELSREAGVTEKEARALISYVMFL